MKKYAILTISFLFASIFVNNSYRIFQSTGIIYPFPYRSEINISLAWYTKILADHVSFTLLMTCIIYVLKPIILYIEKSEWIGKNPMLIFVRLWHRIFCIVFIVSIADIFHYLLAFKQSQIFFLVQNAIFIILTSYYLFKAYKK
jgi:hypothetical protein